MMRLTVIILLALTSAAGMATTYKWVDDSGTVHYSDVPREGAEEVELQSAQSYAAPVRRPRVLPPSTPTDPDAVADNAVAYSEFSIASPTAGETLNNIGGVMQVSLSLAPGLANRHGITLYFDGQQVNDAPSRTTSFQVNDVFRGTHTLRATISDAAGQQVTSTPVVTFYVRQAAIRR